VLLSELEPEVILKADLELGTDGTSFPALTPLPTGLIPLPKLVTWPSTVLAAVRESLKYSQKCIKLTLNIHEITYLNQ
jgi:hypothetical protein